MQFIRQTLTSFCFSNIWGHLRTKKQALKLKTIRWTHCSFKKCVCDESIMDPHILLCNVIPSRIQARPTNGGIWSSWTLLLFNLLMIMYIILPPHLKFSSFRKFISAFLLNTKDFMTWFLCLGSSYNYMATPYSLVSAASSGPHQSAIHGPTCFITVHPQSTSCIYHQFVLHQSNCTFRSNPWLTFYLKLFR